MNSHAASFSLQEVEHEQPFGIGQHVGFVADVRRRHHLDLLAERRIELRVRVRAVDPHAGLALLHQGEQLRIAVVDGGGCADLSRVYMPTHLSVMAIASGESKSTLPASSMIFTPALR